MENKIYDLIIVGSGPAGLAASLYASRYKLEQMVFGSNNGGQMGEIHLIENWPGEKSISGRELIEKFVSQVESYGIKINPEAVYDVRKNSEGIFEVQSSSGTYLSRTVVLAMGAKYRSANISGEKEFTGHGVCYCATCDGFFFREKIVCVIGGGNSAAVAALELSEIAKKVYVIFRKEEMTAEPFWLDKIKAVSNVELVSGTNVTEIQGEGKVEKVILDKEYQGKNYLELNGVFVEVGSEPGVELAQKLGVEIDEQNYIKINPDQSTNVSGVFAAGDITTGSNKFRQVLTAAAEGSIAASSAYKFVKLK